MPVTTVGGSKEGDYTVLPEGEVVAATVLNVEQVPSSFKDDDGNDQEQFQWDFIVTDEGPFKGKKIRSWTTTNFVAHPNCKAYTWAKAILRRDFKEGESFDTDDLISHACRLVVGVTADGKWNRVSSVLPAKEASSLTTSESPQETPF
jgi:hypothetical protein